MGKPHQRRCRIDATTISAELGRFLSGEYRFAATPEFNDMWLEIDLQGAEFEEAELDYIHRVLGQQYKRFLDAQPKEHC